MEKTKVVHKEDCARVFKRYDASCPRCQELIVGATARPGWSRPYRPYVPQSCSHGAHNLNPGGYCNICGSGNDFS